MMSSANEQMKLEIMAKASTSIAETKPSTAIAESAAAVASAAKPKRVRTGCLTCRERHLKCDEGLPDCVNCQKSGRLCKRGVRLNFIDTDVKPLLVTPPPSDEWNVTFRDESREIASDYKGGAQRYANLNNNDMATKDEQEYQFNATMLDAPVMSHQQLPPQQVSAPQSYSTNPVDMFPAPVSVPQINQEPRPRHGSTASDTTFASNGMGDSTMTYTNGDQSVTPPGDSREILTNPEELLFMQVFVEEVAIWMDSMDPYKHVGTCTMDLRIMLTRESFPVSFLLIRLVNRCF